MTIPTPPSHQTAEQFRHAEEAILAGKLLSYLPSEGWGYRTMDEIKEGKEDEAVR